MSPPLLAAQEYIADTTGCEECVVAHFLPWPFAEARAAWLSFCVLQLPQAPCSIRNEQDVGFMKGGRLRGQ